MNIYILILELYSTVSKNPQFSHLQCSLGNKNNVGSDDFTQSGVNDLTTVK